MIEVSGQLTVAVDLKTNAAFLDIRTEWDEDASLLQKPLTDLIGQEVYILVLPKAEMMQMCQCGHIYAKHTGFENFGRTKNGSSRTPSMGVGGCRAMTWAGHSGGCCPPDYCECSGFKPQ
jgi:hypothetical protein